MFYPVIILFISLLLVSSIQSIYSLKISQIQNNIVDNSVQTVIFQEEIVKNAIDSYCRTNFNICKADTLIDDIFTVNAGILTPYMPSLIIKPGYFSNLELVRSSATIKIVHTIDNIEERAKYFQHYKNNAVCANGSAIPCDTPEVLVERVFSSKLLLLYEQSEI